MHGSLSTASRAAICERPRSLSSPHGSVWGRPSTSCAGENPDSLIRWFLAQVIITAAAVTSSSVSISFSV
eukprot:7665296-Pyramimonas_sp.AAC.1